MWSKMYIRRETQLKAGRQARKYESFLRNKLLFFIMMKKILFLVLLYFNIRGKSECNPWLSTSDILRYRATGLHCIINLLALLQQFLSLWNESMIIIDDERKFY